MIRDPLEREVTICTFCARRNTSPRLATAEDDKSRRFYNPNVMRESGRFGMTPDEFDEMRTLMQAWRDDDE